MDAGGNPALLFLSVKHSQKHLRISLRSRCCGHTTEVCRTEVTVKRLRFLNSAKRTRGHTRGALEDLPFGITHFNTPRGGLVHLCTSCERGEERQVRLLHFELASDCKINNERITNRAIGPCKATAQHTTQNGSVDRTMLRG